ncbi:hypothetical protein GCM10022239_03380 [Leifsonia bigeumensis]|uniref:Tail terminator n=1 Tax=Leifsonella bigeumensis TaxID=433643 RepID=A0ABP7F295_9MICO
MADSYLVLFDRALAQALDDLELGLYKPTGTYTAAESTLAKPAILVSGPDLPTTLDNCIVLNQLDPIIEGRADLVHRVQIISRLAGTKTQARNLAWSLRVALDQKEQIPPGFYVSWSTIFSELAATRDESGRYTTYQNFHFRGRRPL